jgi:uncharacterized repeat protein (TIGR03803 family)
MKKFNSVKMAGIVIAFCAATAIWSTAQNFTTLASFTGTDGIAPIGTLVQGNDGNFYGTTSSGGVNGNFGTVFTVTPDGTLTTLYSFCSQTDCTDGANPQGALVLAKNGNFYGTTYLGGTNCVNPGNPNTGCGTVFEITPQGQLTTVYSFCSQVVFGLCNDGSSPYAGLIQGTDGNLYGSTGYGGGNAADNNCFCSGFGTLFKITTAGQLTTLYDFCNFTNSNGFCLDGGVPIGGLIQAANGHFYGTTYNGGTGHDNSGGTIFEMTSSGTLTTLYSFCHRRNCIDGAYPFAGMIQAKNGMFYGVTRYGGYNGWGTVFEMTAKGNLTTLHRFRAYDGVSPYSALVQGSDGNFYGTTPIGGANFKTGNNSGTVFKITPQGGLTTLYNFCAQTNCTDGQFPYAGLVQGANGDFYGATYSGGANGDGTVFSVAVGLRAAADTP